MEGKIKLMMVDDSNDILERMKEMLHNEEKIESIKTANTILEAMSVMNQTEINTITLDIGLPDGNGLDFLKWLKDKFPKTRVVMVSNKSHEFYRKTAKEYGADYFLDKSTEYEYIRQTIINTPS